MDEKWVQFRDTHYEVSDQGRIRNSKTGKIRKPQRVSTRRTYHQIKLHDKKSKKIRQGEFFYVHRMVMEAFRGPCPEGMEVNHRDCNGYNNALDNLEYVTRLGNKIHAFDNGRGLAAVDTRKEIKEIARLYREGMKRKVIAEKFNTTVESVWRIGSGRSWNEFTGLPRKVRT